MTVVRFECCSVGSLRPGSGWLESVAIVKVARVRSFVYVLFLIQFMRALIFETSRCSCDRRGSIAVRR